MILSDDEQAQIDKWVQSTGNVADGLHDIADALRSVSAAIVRLGNGDAASPLGAIENLAGEMQNGFRSVSVAIESLSREDQ